ncbi:MAG: hypothetical protein AMXMBFR64_04400 [Myxococcales bacterium]
MQKRALFTIALAALLGACGSDAGGSGAFVPGGTDTSGGDLGGGIDDDIGEDPDDAGGDPDTASPQDTAGTDVQTGPDVVTPTGLKPGDLMISEIMKNPKAVADTAGEWVEVMNTTSAPIPLDGLTLKDLKTDKHVIASNGALVVPAGGVVVLANNGDRTKNGGVTVDYVYTGFTMGNGADEVILANGATIIDKVAYGAGTAGWPDTEGVAMMLPPGEDAGTNDQPGAWCAAGAPMEGGDLGTPGVVNPPCGTLPELVCDDAKDDDEDGLTDCDDPDCAKATPCKVVDPTLCGNGSPDTGEECDDANDTPGDGCEPDCTKTPVCGDGKLGKGEECDDGKTLPGDGCSRHCKVEVALAPGALVITEIHYNPKAVDDAKGEWFELYNTTGDPIDIDGLLLTDNKTDKHVVDPGGPLVIPAGGYVVLGNNGDPLANGDANVTYAYKSFSLTNTADQVVISFAGQEVDRVEYTVPPFPKLDAVSMQLDALLLDHVANDAAESWCASTAPYGAGDKGTPGLPNGSCGAAPPTCGNGDPDPGEECDDGNTDPGDGCDPSCKKESAPVTAGVIVITELMPDPAKVADTAGEWVELQNVTNAPIDIKGWVLGDGANEKHTIAESVVVPAKGIIVLARNKESAANGGVTAVYQYTGVNLSNTADTVQLAAGAVVVDKVQYGGAGWEGKIKAGKSISLDPDWTDAVSNDDPAHWCVGVALYGDGDSGTPGAPNEPCP